MKNLILTAMILLVVVLTAGCGRLPDVNLNVPSQTQPPSSNAAKAVLTTTTTCHAISPLFSDVQSLSYTIVDPHDGTKKVTCLIVNTSGDSYQTTVQYPNSQDPAFQYSGFCTVYYEHAHNFTFMVPGNYNPSHAEPKATEVGWEITGVPGQPANGYQYSWTTCQDTEGQ